MPDLRDETAEDGFHEIQFSSKELVFLFMAASVILIFVFLAGVLVGRDTTARAGETPIAAGDAPPAESSASAPPAEDPKPTTGPETPGAPQGDPLSYPKALGGKEAPVPQPVSEPPVPPAETEPKPTPPPAAPAETSKPDPAPTEKVDRGPDVPTSGRRGEWVIQVAALKTRRAAAESVQNLRAKGYDAFLEDTAKGLYRVRIGKFRTREEADRVAQRLLKEGTKSVVQR